MLTKTITCYNMSSNMILTVFRAGNSDVVALNPVFKQKLGISTGSKVIQEVVEGGILIKPVSAKTKKTKKSDQEFEKWWKMFEGENGGVLDDLA